VAEAICQVLGACCVPVSCKDYQRCTPHLGSSCLVNSTLLCNDEGMPSLSARVAATKQWCLDYGFKDTKP
jgi:hypothetical protein